MEHNQECISIAVDEKYIYMIGAMAEEDVLVLTRAAKMERSQDIQRDIKHLSHMQQWDGEDVAIVSNTETITMCETVPKMATCERDARIECMMDESEDWLRHDRMGFNHCRVIRPLPESHQTPERYELISVAMIPTEEVSSLITTVHATRGRLRIIDYWSGPLWQLSRENERDEMHSRVHVVFGEADAKLIVWYDNVILEEIDGIRTEDDWNMAMIRADSLTTTYGVPPITGVRWCVPESMAEQAHIQSIDDVEDAVDYGVRTPWEDMVTQWGEAAGPDFHRYGSSTDIIDEQAMPWQNALGLAARGVWAYGISHRR